jgi:hypothetical protein
MLDDPDIGAESLTQVFHPTADCSATDGISLTLISSPFFGASLVPHCGATVHCHQKRFKKIVTASPSLIGSNVIAPSTRETFGAPRN